MVALIIILVIIVAIALYFVSTYNNLISLRNKVNDQWSQIDVELKRRFDLIPNLVETVKGYAKHEKETLENVIKARNSYLTAGTKEQALKADKELNGALSRLLVTVEQYPDLKANQSFLDLQAQLKDTEDKISFARKFYNDTALKLNNAVEMFPSNLVANMFKFTKVEYFKADDSEKENVKVEF